MTSYAESTRMHLGVLGGYPDRRSIVRCDHWKRAGRSPEIMLKGVRVAAIGRWVGKFAALSEFAR